MANVAGTVDGRRTGLWLGLLILGMVVIGGVGVTLYARGRWWLPPLASAEGAQIDRLFYSTLAITGAVFVLVHVLLALFVWRYAAGGDRKALYWHDNRRLEMMWTIVPAVALAIMVSASGAVWARLHLATPPQGLEVDVRGEQFAWLSRYPGPDGKLGQVDPARIDHRTNPMGLNPQDPAAADDVVSSELHLVVHKPARIRLRSTGVIHSFYVPAFRVKQDAVPGVTIDFWFTPTVEGQYEIACAELCGIGHYAMKGKLVVESQQAFDTWLARQTPSLQKTP
ncbi:MAG: cytochrome c oxidase subunit II [Armatimonadota bacterium]|nr:cytochrome c oxidase subunit II [Armatimonadota bacterium]